MEKNKNKRNKSKKKIWIIIIAVAVLLFIAFKIFKPKSNDGAVQKFENITVRESVIKKHIEISGNIEAAQKQILQSPGEGIVKKVGIKEGDFVKKGQLIFSLDSSRQKMQVAQQEYAIAQEEINGSSINLQLMKKELELLKKQLADRSIYAKFDGIVAKFSLDEGYYAKPQDNFGVIIDRTYLKSTVSVSERDASKLAVGQEVLLEFVALPDVEVKGKITAYPSIAKVNQAGGGTVVEAKLIVKEPPKEILPGYSFYGKVVYGKDEKVILISQQALFYEKGNPYVKKVVNENEIKTIQVEVEPYLDGSVKLISGDIKDGDVLQTEFMSGGMF